MLDIHAHLYWDSYDADRDRVIERAFAAGVERIICVGTTIEESRQAIVIAEKYEHIFAAVGLHPHFYNEASENPDFKTQTSDQPRCAQHTFQTEIEELRVLAKHPKVVAIGECGLDYFSRDPLQPVTDEQKAIQREGFLSQMAIAESEHLSLIIHTRPSLGSMDAYEDVLDVLKAQSDWSADGADQLEAVVLHCYQGDTVITQQFLELPHVYFSFAGNITYPVKKALLGTKDNLSAVVRLVPLERLFVETDAPFLAPQGHRGERNEPAFVIATAEKICELKQCNVSVLEASLGQNALAVFVKMCYNGRDK